jgi:hypothetical protein
MRIWLCLVFLIFLACKGNDSSDFGTGLQDLEWMIGKWQKEDSNVYEMWSKKEHHFYGGLVVTTDSLEKSEIKEVLSLESRKDGVFLNAKVIGQNRERKVEFKMSNTNFKAPKFSNELHDYPNHINYMKIGTDKIKVEISGNNGNSNFYYYNRKI